MAACGSAPWWTGGCCISTTGEWIGFPKPDGLSGRSVHSFFEDREGNIWVATAEGLDRFRDFAIPTFSDLQGFSSGGIFSVLTAKDGSLWLGTSDGLNRWNKGQITNYRYRGFGGVRGGSRVSGLTAGREADSRGTVREITDSGLPDKAHSLFQDARGRMWVGTPSGVAFLKADRFVLRSIRTRTESSFPSPTTVQGTSG